MKELSLYNSIKDFLILDVVDMRTIENESFDCVVCIGGVINYLFEKELTGIEELLRVLKPGGKLIVGAMSFIGAALNYLDSIREEKKLFGIEATKWIFNTGVQDEEHYPIQSKHYVHMMRSSEMDTLFSNFPVKVIEKSSAGLFSQSGNDVLENARQDKEFWALVVKQEIEFTKLSGTLDCGMNIIYVVEKNK